MVNPTRKRKGNAQNFRRAIPAEPLLSTPRKTSRHIDCSHSSLNGKTRQLSKDYHISLHALTIQAETLPCTIITCMYCRSNQKLCPWAITYACMYWPSKHKLCLDGLHGCRLSFDSVDVSSNRNASNLSAYKLNSSSDEPPNYINESIFHGL